MWWLGEHDDVLCSGTAALRDVRRIAASSSSCFCFLVFPIAYIPCFTATLLCRLSIISVHMQYGQTFALNIYIECRLTHLAGLSRPISSRFFPSLPLFPSFIILFCYTAIYRLNRATTAHQLIKDIRKKARILSSD